MFRIGSHVSTAGGVEKAVDRQVEIKGNCGQLFVGSPRGWKVGEVKKESADLFKKYCSEKDVGPWIVHGTYLINLATPKGLPGTLVVTLIYVILGVIIQYLFGLGLALLCVQNIKGRNFFRMVFFIPMMITPVGIAYLFRMLTDMTKGPFAPIVMWLGMEETSWAVIPWGARIAVMIGDAWQWIPFMFIVLLAGLESLSTEQKEAAIMDGAGTWQMFRDITWPTLLPVSVTIILIRLIEAFKIIDLPNVMTNGGPGIATESLSLHSYFNWRTMDLNGSAAVGYLLMIVSVFICLSFVNLVKKRVEIAQQ